MSYRELLIGCGSVRSKKIRLPEMPEEWASLTTVDINPAHKPDVVHDLNVLPWPFKDNSFDECHAYEVLEHLGQQGDHVSFFAHFSEIWRVLKPNGLLLGSVPMWNSPWAWGDPSHRRVITDGSLAFLSQKIYERDVGKTTMTDYRDIYKADFEPVAAMEGENSLGFIMKALK